LGSTIRVYERLKAGAIFVFLITFEVDFDEGNGLGDRVIHVMH
jgi:hypothetical protein